MGIGSRDKESVHLFPNQISMSQKLDMNMFEITFWKFSFQDESNGLRVLIILKRKFISEIMTTYFPSFLLLATTLATTFFKPFFFEAALSVNLTTMLVMTTIFISKMESLPPTSNIKMLDFWLIFCQIIPFAEVVLLTAMEYQRGDNNDVPLNPSRVNVLPKCKDEIDIQAEDIHGKINLIFSILSVPKLKTLGKLVHAFPSKSLSFRENLSATADIDIIHDLFWSRSLPYHRPALVKQLHYLFTIFWKPVFGEHANNHSHTCFFPSSGPRASFHG